MTSIASVGAPASLPAQAAAAANDGDKQGFFDRIPVVGEVKRGIGAVTGGMGMATRHTLDSIFLGLPSERWNMRDDYRTDYTPGDRTGADVGDAIPVALAPAAALWYTKKGAPALGTGTIRKLGTRAVTYGALAGVTLASAKKVKEHVEDKGNASPILAGVGLIGAPAAVKFFGSRGGKIASGKAMAAAGVVGLAAGAIGGSHITTGESQIGTPHTKVWIPAEDPLGKAAEFGRGAVTHFAESGPGSQGFSLGNEWGQRHAFRTNYSKPEQSGAAIAGDLGAALLMSSGALVAARGILAKNPDASADAGRLGKAAIGMGNLSANGVARLATLPGAKTSAALIAGGLVAHETLDWARDYGGAEWGVAGAAVTGGVALGSARLVRSSALAKAMPAGIRPALDPVAAVALVSALSLARTPVGHFINDSRDGWAQTDTDQATKVAIGAAAIVGGLGIPQGVKIAKGLGGTSTMWKVVGGVAGAALGAGIGAGVTPFLPGVDRAGVNTLPVEDDMELAPGPSTPSHRGRGSKPL